MGTSDAEQLVGDVDDVQAPPVAGSWRVKHHGEELLSITIQMRHLFAALLAVVALSTAIGFAIATFINPGTAGAQRAQSSATTKDVVVRELRDIEAEVKDTCKAVKKVSDNTGSLYIGCY